MAIVLIRTLILYFLVVFIFRFIGKKQIGELQPSELVLAIMISDLATVPMQSTGNPLTNGIIPIIVLMTAEISISYFSQKSVIFRKIITGSPSILIEKGEINIKELNKLRLNIDDLFEQLRSSGYFSVNEVEYAILETNGQLSVVPKGELRGVTLKDIGKNEEGTLPRNIIKDGIVDYENLKIIKKNRKWLNDIIKNNGFQSEKEIFLLTSDGKNSLFIQKKENV